MKVALKFICLCGLLTAAYLAGSHQLLDPVAVQAQDNVDPDDPADGQLSKEEKDRISALSQAFYSTMEGLIETQKYRPAIEGINTFAVSSGGLNAIEDLESGEGVDPETFAGLYADLAIPEIAEHLGRDDRGRVTYKNKVVQLYSISKLKSLFEKRSKLFDENIE